jgi:hypothetical protein
LDYLFRYRSGFLEVLVEMTLGAVCSHALSKYLQSRVQQKRLHNSKGVADARNWSLGEEF